MSAKMTAAQIQSKIDAKAGVDLFARGRIGEAKRDILTLEAEVRALKEQVETLEMQLKIEKDDRKSQIATLTSILRGHKNVIRLLLKQNNLEWPKKSKKSNNLVPTRF